MLLAFLPIFRLLWGKTLDEIIPSPHKLSPKRSRMRTQIYLSKNILLKLYPFIGN